MKEFTDFFLKNWILIVILGNFLVAVSSIISKIVVSGSVGKPIQPTPYAFYSGIGGIIVFLPALLLNIRFNFLSMDLKAALFGLSAGIILVLSLWPFYFVLKRNETSRVMTLFVGAVPIFTFLLKYIFVGEVLSALQMLAFIFLVAGGVIISFRQHRKRGLLSLKNLPLTLLSAFGMALGLTLAEATFRLQGFLNGLIWMTGGYFFSSVILLLLPGQREKIFSVENYPEKINVVLFFSEKLIGASGLILIKFAISLISVTLVNAFEGLKQFFVLILASIISLWRPDILKEELRGVVLWQKLIAAVLVFAGIFLLIYSN